MRAFSSASTATEYHTPSCWIARVGSSKCTAALRLCNCSNRTWLKLRKRDWRVLRIMISVKKKRVSRETSKRRRVEVEQCLAELGLSSGPRRLRRPTNRQNEDHHCRRLKAALLRLGPLFSAFGLYLSSRVDLFPIDYCLELSTIPDRRPSTPPIRAMDLMHQEMGMKMAGAFLHIQPEPFQSRLVFQTHLAVLRDGSHATVKVIH